MKIARELLDEIVAHAREDAPNECCGIVGGRDGEALTVHRARNEFASPTRFMVHALDQFKITQEIEDAGNEIVAMYHSHPKSEAKPSPTDVNLADGWPDPLWVICSLMGAEPTVRAFSIRDGDVEEVELAVR
jgi:proteasome lid subunit RPN8/RPN11